MSTSALERRLDRSSSPFPQRSMAKLKAALTKAEFETLSEGKPFYVERNGIYALDVDGMTPDEDVAAIDTKLAEFRDSNRALFRTASTGSFKCSST